MGRIHLFSAQCCSTSISRRKMSWKKLAVCREMWARCFINRIVWLSRRFTAPVVAWLDHSTDVTQPASHFYVTLVPPDSSSISHAMSASSTGGCPPQTTDQEDSKDADAKINSETTESCQNIGWYMADLYENNRDGNERNLEKWKKIELKFVFISLVSCYPSCWWLRFANGRCLDVYMEVAYILQCDELDMR